MHVYRSAIQLDTYIGTDNLDHSVYRARIYRRRAGRSSFFTDCRFSRQLKRARRRYPRCPLGFVVAESTADRLVRGCSLHRSFPLAADLPFHGCTWTGRPTHTHTHALTHPGVWSLRLLRSSEFCLARKGDERTQKRKKYVGDCVTVELVFRHPDDPERKESPATSFSDVSAIRENARRVLRDPDDPPGRRELLDDVIETQVNERETVRETAREKEREREDAAGKHEQIPSVDFRREPVLHEREERCCRELAWSRYC